MSLTVIIPLSWPAHTAQDYLEEALEYAHVEKLSRESSVLRVEYRFMTQEEIAEHFSLL